MEPWAELLSEEDGHTVIALGAKIGDVSRDATRQCLGAFGGRAEPPGA